MDKYRIAIVIVIACVIIYVIYTFTKKTNRVAVTLTGPRNANNAYTVTQPTISKINNDISTSNYAISIWQYIDAWADTNTLKSVINIPDVLQLSLGETTNDLILKMYSNPAIAPSTSSISSSSISSSSMNITDTGSTGGYKGTYSDKTVSCPQPPMNLSGIEVNNVYRYNTNTYIFTYYTNENDSSKTKWKDVRIIYSINDPTENLTVDALYYGGTVSSLLLETNGNIPSNGIKQAIQTSCPKWDWSCKPRPKNEPCDKASNIDICEPSVSTPLKNPYPTYMIKGRQITTAMYTITSKGQPYFVDKQKFRFLYYSVNPKQKTFMPIPDILSDIITVLPYYSNTIDSFVGYNEVYPTNEPNALPTKTALLDLSENNLITQEATIHESLIGAQPVDVTYKISNMPMQTWTNIILNINGVNLTVYINGQIRSAYILPFVPNQMNNEIQLTSAPSFTGWTSNLRYIPYGVSAGEAQQIYSEGYMGKSATSGWYSFFNRYSLKVIFVDNLGK